jgi:hypothetical protein
VRQLKALIDDLSERRSALQMAGQDMGFASWEEPVAFDLVGLDGFGFEAEQLRLCR